MPLDGKQLDELLSGFVDGELTRGERELVEKAARDDARVAQRIESLRRQSSWVWQVGQAQLHQPAQWDEQAASVHAGEPGSSTLAQRVIAEARQRGRELGLPATHYVRPAAGDVVHLPTAGADVSRGSGDFRRAQRPVKGWLALGGLAAAAAVLLAITWSKLEQQNLPSTPANQLAQRDNQSDQRLADRLEAGRLEGEDGPAAQLSQETLASDGTPPETPSMGADANQAAGSSLVGVSDGLAYALVVDIEVTAQAERSRVIEKLLTAAGIPLAPPVAVNAEILKALDDSRLIVRDPTSKVHAVSIQVVRGGLQELDGALRRVWQDSDNFPNVGLNLSIDSRAALMREMLRSSGDRFAATDRFAVPLAFDQAAQAAVQGDLPPGRSSPLMADDAGVQYVSNSQRENGWESLGELPGTTSQSLATILLVIHYAD